MEGELGSYRSGVDEQCFQTRAVKPDIFMSLNPEKDCLACQTHTYLASHRPITGDSFNLDRILRMGFRKYIKINCSVYMISFVVANCLARF